MKLYINGILAVEGQEIETFRGEKGILKSWREPHKPSSSGHVTIVLDDNCGEREYYPSVINGKFDKKGEFENV